MAAVIKTTHLTSAFCVSAMTACRRNQQEGKLLAQVCALKAKHFHLCNRIAEASSSSILLEQDGQGPWGAQNGWPAGPLILRRDWLCLLGHCGVWLCEMESSVWSVGPASALMQKIILSASRERDARAAKWGDCTQRGLRRRLSGYCSVDLLPLLVLICFGSCFHLFQFCIRWQWKCSVYLITFFCICNKNSKE